MSRIFPFSALPACRRCLLGMASRSTHQSTSTTSLPAPPVRLFSVSLAHQKKQMPSRPQPPPDSEIDEMFVKGTGPGGQKINKTNSAVQLRHRPTGIVVKSQATRSRSQNRAIARGLLAARLDELWNGPASRTAVVAVAKQKKKANSTKKARRKYRKLEEEKEKEKEKEKLAREGVVAEGALSEGNLSEALVAAAGGAVLAAAATVGASAAMNAAGRVMAVEEEEEEDDEGMLEEEQDEEEEEEDEEEEEEDEDEEEDNGEEVWKVKDNVDFSEKSKEKTRARPGRA